MGKITVQGYAEKEVNYDLVTLTITFRAREKTAGRATQEVMKQCDDFLKELCSKGVKLDEIHLEGDSVGHSYRDREQDVTTAERKIEVTIPFQMKFMNSIMELIQKQRGDIDYQTEFCLSDPQKIHEQLLTEAILDAKKKAESMAAALGLQVLELKSASPGCHGVIDKFLNCMALSDDIDYCDEDYVSDALEASLSKESESVETIWLIG